MMRSLRRRLRAKVMAQRPANPTTVKSGESVRCFVIFVTFRPYGHSDPVYHASGDGTASLAFEHNNQHLIVQGTEVDVITDISWPMDPDSWMENYSKNLTNLLFLDKLEDHMANKILSLWDLFPELRDHPYAGGGTDQPYYLR